MGHIEHEALAPKSVSVAVITVSDSRTLETDESGRLIKDVLINHSHRIHSYHLLPNNTPGLDSLMEDLLGSAGIDAVVITGGTGLSHKDITIETVSPKFQKRMDGFGELFRSLSYQEIGAASVLSRAAGGITNGKVVLCLPGSAAAVRLALEKIIVPELPHMVREASR
ncbi:molybdenum cofactor biosynthesis protein B [Dehalogenimonas formicexedens]|uniref:Molybdenum cofactor biosynthesis protein B n=1 Tax=Dehalogenimonas formicexedens TaxID=1839801 RepID=A0A1P8F5L7_9CHLR|nr:MogA/MoaB family molybdenum cofactor biosynthesis protein [Dehalogenimonas formicexedens]APV43774.1 molybdenum cofactor biosynthesis protein B [Dehalogenimonas formicexedens]